MRRRRDRGFTLIELLISLGIALVGLLGLMALQLVAVRGNSTSRNFLEATGLAQERLEATQVCPYANLPTMAATENNLSPIQGDSVRAVYTRVTSVAAGTNTTTVTVQVSWNDNDIAGKTHQVTLRTTRSP